MANIQLSGSVGVPGSVFILGDEAISMPDADLTMSPAEYSNYFLSLTGELTATRRLIAPLNPGQTFLVQNDTAGGFGVEVVGATGNGIVVPNGSILLVGTDGTSYDVIGGGTGGAIIFRPGGVAGGNIHTSAATVAVAIANASGAVTVYVDTSLAPGNVAMIPSGVVWDFKLYGRLAGQANINSDVSEPGDFPRLIVSDGAKLMNLGRMANIAIECDCITSPAFDYSDWAVSPYVECLNIGLNMGDAATVAAWQVPADAQLSLDVTGSSSYFFSPGATPIVSLAAAASLSFSLEGSYSSGVSNYLVSGDGTTTFFYIADDAAFPVPTQTAFSGATTVTFLGGNVPIQNYLDAELQGQTAPSGTGPGQVSQGVTVYALDSEAEAIPFSLVGGLQGVGVQGSREILVPEVSYVGAGYSSQAQTSGKLRFGTTLTGPSQSAVFPWSEDGFSSVGTFKITVTASCNSSSGVPASGEAYSHTSFVCYRSNAPGLAVPTVSGVPVPMIFADTNMVGSVVAIAPSGSDQGQVTYTTPPGAAADAVIEVQILIEAELL